MATAFAEREMERRSLADDVEVVTGGTRPADEIHGEVVQSMRDIELEVSLKTPREITAGEIRSCDIVITMGCSADDVCPAGFSGDSRDWELDDPDGRPREEVALIRDQVEQRVGRLFDEIERRL